MEMQSIDVIKNINKNKNDISNINYELSKTENTKYTTENGIKEFSCKDGYVDNVVIEGETLVNLVDIHETKVSNDGSAFVSFFSEQDGLHADRISNGTYTLFNLCDKDLIFEVSDIGGYTNYSQIVVSPFSSKVATIPNGKRIYSCFGAIANFGTIEKFKQSQAIILEGDHTDKPISYFEGLKSVGQGDKIDVLTLTDNLFDENDFVVGSTGSIEGEKFVIDDKATTRITHTQPIPVNMFDYLELQYANNVKVFIYELDKNDTILKRYSWSKYPFIRAITPNTKYIRVIFSYDDDRTMTLADYNKINPFLTNKYDKKQILTTLRSLPNGVKDTVEKRGNKYVKVQRCKEIVLDSSLEFTGTGVSNQVNTRGQNIILSDLKQDTNSLVICSAFKSTHRDYEASDEEHLINLGDGRLRVRILKSKLSSDSLGGYKTYLDSIKPTVVYELETPIITELPNFNPQTYEGDTTLLINSGVIQTNADFEVTNSIGSKVEVLKDKVSSLDKEVIDLNGNIKDVIDKSVLNRNTVITGKYDLNNIYNNGVYKIQKTDSEGTPKNLPNGVKAYGTLLVLRGCDDRDNRTVQIYIPDTKNPNAEGTLCYRSYNDNIWRNWQKVIADSTLSLLESQINILEEENKNLKIEQEQQNEEILVNMLANTEMFEMLLGMIPMTLSEDKTKNSGINSMTEVYCTLIIKGVKTIEDVPLVIREQVIERLKQLEVPVK